MPAQALSAEREVGHKGKGEIGIDMIGINRLDVVEVTLHTVVALHDVKLCPEREPRVESIAAVDARIKAFEIIISLVNTAGLRPFNTREG